MSRKPRRESTRQRPAQVTLAVVLQVREGRLQALLWQRAREPFLGAWSLPGGYLEAGETLEQSIRRHLAEKVDVRELAHLEQLATLSDPGRNPLERELANAYLGLVPRDVDPEVPDDTTWHPVSRLPELAFDHREIVLAGRERLRAKLSDRKSTRLNSSHMSISYAVFCLKKKKKQKKAIASKQCSDWRNRCVG